jgi:Ca2+-binding RTX toxin-like protein
VTTSCSGGGGDDRLLGGNGSDVLIGGTSSDALDQGRGRDPSSRRATTPDSSGRHGC